MKFLRIAVESTNTSNTFTLDDIKIWDGTTDTSGDPDYTFDFAPVEMTTSTLDTSLHAYSDPADATGGSRMGIASAFEFDGSTTGYRVENDALSFMSGQPTFTLSTWIYPDSVSNDETFFYFGKTQAVDGESFTAQITSSGAFNVSTINGDLDCMNPTNVSMNTMQWNHVAFTGDGSTLKYYLNGDHYQSCSMSGGDGLNITNDSTPQMTIGHYRDGSGSYLGHWDGKISQVLLLSLIHI